MDTQALGMLLVAVTGQSLAAYAEKELWQSLGMEQVRDSGAGEFRAVSRHR